MKLHHEPEITQKSAFLWFLDAVETGESPFNVTAEVDSANIRGKRSNMTKSGRNESSGLCRGIVDKVEGIMDWEFSHGTTGRIGEAGRGTAGKQIAIDGLISCDRLWYGARP